MVDLIDNIFQIKIEKSNNNLTMKWSGRFHESDPDRTLYPFFNKLVKDIKTKKLTIDFCQLEDMNWLTYLTILKL